MKASIVIAALLASTATAGVRIETITRDSKTLAASGKAQLVEVQNGAVRSQGDGSGMILKAGKIIIIDDKKKTWSELDKATMQGYANQANAAMAQMQERMKNMPPEQRAQMEKMMGGMAMPGAGKPVVFEAKKTGKTDTVEGRKCANWHLLQDGKIIEEMCVVPFNSLPGKEDMKKSFQELTEAFQGFASAVPNAAEQVKVRNTIDGYPVRTRPYVNGAPSGTEHVLKSWTEASIPAAQFEVPAGYKKKELPRPGK